MKRAIIWNCRPADRVRGAGLVCLAGLALGAMIPAFGQTQRVSIGTLGEQGNDHSTTSLYGLSSSGHGEIIAFTSFANNLVPNDTNVVSDVFVRDTMTGITELVSVGMLGVSGNNTSYNPTVSSDGRFVAFASSASDLVPNDTNGYVDVFLRDRQTQQTILISQDPGGNVGNAFSSFPSIAVSPDGLFVYLAFTSHASNLVPGDVNGLPDIIHCTYDVTTGAITHALASIGGGGTQGDEASVLGAISANGRYIVYTTYIWNIIPPSTTKPVPPVLQIMVYDHALGGTFFRLVTTPDEGTFPAISGDGRFFAYVEGGKVILYDILRFKTEVVSVADDGTEANGPSAGPTISEDGRVVAFNSASSNLVTGDTNGVDDVFVRDRAISRTVRASITQDAREANGASRGASVSDDGKRVIFSSLGTNLVSGDTNLKEDVFVNSTETFQPGSQPDLLIRNSNESWYVGNDVYNTNGEEQTRAQSADIDRTAVYHMKLANDGGSPDTFTVSGAGSQSGWTVRYYDALQGGTEVSAQVIGPGWSVGPLSPGESREFRVEVAPESGVPPEAPLELMVRATSQIEVTRADAVKAITSKASSTIQPDMLVRNQSETDYVGNNVYNATGQKQYRSQNATPDQAAVFQLKVQNDGTVTDSVTVTGGESGAGWIVRYYTGTQGGTDITAQVVGAGWNGGPLGAGEFLQFRAEVSLEPGNPPATPKDLLITGTSAANSGLSDTVACSTFRASLAAQPDLLIKNSDETWYVGNDLYNTTSWGQSRSQTADQGDPAIYHVKLQNDGTLADTYTLTGTGGGQGWIVQYFDALTGGAEITSQLTGAGYSVGPLAPGGLRELRVEVSLEPGVTAVDSVMTMITALSGRDGTRKDAVSPQTSRAATASQPDMMIKTDAESLYYGNDIYNATGSNQRREQTADLDRQATYQLKIQNDGSVPDSFLITGTGGTSGWVVQYFDALTGGTDITGQVIGVGANTGTLAPGTSRGYRVVVSPESGVIPQGPSLLLIKGQSVANSDRADTVRATTTRRTSVLQPDLLIRKSSEPLYSGNDVYETSGSQQRVSQTAKPAEHAAYVLKLQNDGTASDSFVLTGSGSGAGWEVRYYDQIAGGTEITSQIIGVGLTVGPLAKGATRELRAEVAMESGVLPQGTHELKLTARSEGDSSAVDAVRGLTSGVTSSSQPDALIRKSTEPLYTGNDIYNSNGADQMATTPAAWGQPAVYILKLQNDGTESESFVVTGTGGTDGWVVTYFDASVGGNDITDEVTGPGHGTSVLAAGTSVQHRVEVSLEPGVPPQSNLDVLVTVKSGTLSTLVDAVKARTTRSTLSSQPDMLVKMPTDQWYTGNDIYNTTAEQQTVTQAAQWNGAAVFQLKVQNDGPVMDSFVVTGPAGGNGWTVTYYDAQVGGADITAEVVASAGWFVGPLAPGASQEFRVELTTDAGVPPSGQRGTMVTAGSASDGAKSDRAQAVANPPEPRQFTRSYGQGLWMVGVPANPTDPRADRVFGTTQTARWNADSQSYLAFGYQAFDVTPGRGYFVRYHAPTTMGFGGFAPTGTVTRELVRDWNLLGNPGVSVLPWGSIQSTGAVQPMGWTLNDAGTGYVLISNLPLANTLTTVQPWQGFWLRAEENCQVWLGVATPASEAGPAPPALDWSVQLAARCGDAVDMCNYIGVTRGEAIVAANPPRTGQAGVDLYVADKGQRNAVSLAGAREKRSWDVVLEADVAGRVEVSFPDLSSVPAELSLTLEDLESGRVVNMRTATSYGFDAQGEGTQRHLRIKAGARSEKALITSASAHAVGKGLEVVYSLATGGEVTVEVMNISGRKVASLAYGMQPSGAHTARWSGKTLMGTRAPSGQYLVSVRCVAQDGTQSSRVMGAAVR